MSCPACFSGHVNPGTPKGRVEKVFGRETYIAEPPDGKPPKGVICVVSDAFGLFLVNNKILADHYAAAGQYLVYVPDFMDGYAAPVRCMINMAHLFDEKLSIVWKPYYLALTIYDFAPHLVRNRWGVSWPKVLSFLNALREDKGKSLPVGVAGFCWGGLHAIKLAADNAETRTPSGRPLADAFFAAHPSNVTLPGDINEVKRNLSIAIGDDDGVMGIEEAKKAKKLLEARDVQSEFVIYPGAKHGFAVRASRAVPDSQETRQAEEAENQAIAWFQKQFAALK